jgi:hypothetical protein
MSPTPGTPSPGGVTQAPGPSPNSTPSGASTDLYPAGRVLPRTAPRASGSADQSLPTQQGQTPQPSGGQPKSGAASSGTSGDAAPVTGPTATRTGRNPVDYSIADCMRMWEAATHMTKQEWSSACHRVQNRLENLRADGATSGSAGAGASRE